MTGDQAERVLRTGGPLEIWRRSIERQGGDYIGQMIDEVKEEDMEKAMLALLDRVVRKMERWGPTQYIKGFPEDLAPKLSIKPEFDRAGIRTTVSIDRNKNPHLRKETAFQYGWSPETGYVYCETGVLAFLLDVIATPLGMQECVLHAPSNPGEFLAIGISYRRLDGTSKLWGGDLDKAAAFDYDKIQALVRRIITGEEHG